MSRFLGTPRPAHTPGRRSIYEDRYAREQQIITLISPAGRFVGLDVDGQFVPADRLPSCCDSPIDCDRPECWTHMGYIGQPGYSNRLP